MNKHIENIFKLLFVFSLILIGSFVFTNKVSAATYYVDSSITDTNVGSATPDFTTYNPTTFATDTGTDSVYKTISDINVGSFLPDDQILFRKGQTWRETLTVPSSGTDGHPIIFGAYGSGALPIVDGSDVRTGWTPDLTNYNYGITTLGGSSGNQFAGNIYFSGPHTFIRGGEIQSISMLINATAGANMTCALYTDNAGSPNSLIANSVTDEKTLVGSSVNVFTYSGTKPIVTAGAVYWIATAASSGTPTIYRNAIPGSYKYGYQSRAYNLGFPATATYTSVSGKVEGLYATVFSGIENVYNLSFSQPLRFWKDEVRMTRGASKAALNDQEWFDSSGVTSFRNDAGSPDILNNIITTDLRNNAIYATGKNYITIQDVIVQKTNSVGLKIDGGSHDWTINRVTSRYNYYDGFLNFNNNYNITYNDCIAEYNDEDGFSNWVNTPIHDITYNRCISRYNGNYLKRAGDGDGFTTHRNNYNIFYNSSIAHNNYNSGFALVDLSAGHIYNSVAYANGGDWTAFGGGNGQRGGIYITSDGFNTDSGSNLTWTWKNNITQDNYPMELKISSFLNANSVKDYNTYFRTGENTTYPGLISTNVGAGESWDTYHTTNSHELHSFYSDPLFIDPTNGDFRLQLTSTAINSGVDVGLTTDFLNNLIVGLPDMGAYQFQAPSSPASLSQYKSDGVTAITSGSSTNEDSVVLKFNMSSINSSDSLTPQIEIQELGTAFTNTVTNSGSAITYSGTPVVGTVIITGLTSGSTYHWQARISNPAGNSSWVAMGGSPDFGIDMTAPLTPIANPSSGTYISTQNVTLSATGSDSIRYSTDATPIDCSAGILYTVPILVSTSQTIYVRACDSLNNSSTASFAYTISPASHTSSGSSVSSRFNNLIAMGNLQAAEELKKEFPNQFPNQINPVITPSFTPLPEVQISIITRNLKITTPRMTGDDIKTLQTYFNSKGYDCGLVDGVFGTKTNLAVIEFQLTNGLKVDGIVGPLTREVMK